MSDLEIKFDFSKLKGKIKEVFNTQAIFANEMSMSESTLSNKLNNNVEFTSTEIINSCKLLEIHFDKINEYFFNIQVQKT